MIGGVESGGVARSFPMPSKKKPVASTSSAVEVGVPERAKQLRTRLGYSTVPAFTTFLQIEPKRWYNVESGFPLSKELAFILVQRIPGLTTDWLWFGKSDGLPIQLARRLGVFDPPERA